MQFKKYYLRIAAIFCTVILLLNFNYAFSTPKAGSYDDEITNILSDKTVTRGDFILELAHIAKINISFTKNSDASVYFKDVKNKDPYAKALIDAQFLGFISAKSKLIQPKRPITLVEAKQLALDYFLYNYKSADGDKFSDILDKDLKKRYGEIKNTINRKQANYIEDFLKCQMALAKSKWKSKTVKYTVVTKVKSSQKRVGDKLYVTLDWGIKPTTGYSIDILGYSYQSGTLIISYIAKEPDPDENVTNTPTNPKATKIIDASKMKQNIKILALRQRY